MRFAVGEWLRWLSRLPEVPNEDWQDHFALMPVITQDDEWVTCRMVQRRFFYEPFDGVWCPEYRLKSPVSDSGPSAPSSPQAYELPTKSVQPIPSDSGQSGSSTAPRDPVELRERLDEVLSASSDAVPHPRI